MKKGLILLAVFMFALSGISMAAGINQINRDGHVLNYSDIALGGIMAGTWRTSFSHFVMVYSTPFHGGCKMKICDVTIRINDGGGAAPHLTDPPKPPPYDRGGGPLAVVGAH